MGIRPVVRAHLDVQLVQRPPSHICLFDMKSLTLKAVVNG